ncbi:MAG: replicative DNA helicase [Prevotella sp.]|nr:replicative DNA helicase [Prevotella sp.]
MLHNLEAEQSVIAAVLLDNDCLETFTRLKPSHFYAPAHRIIYEAIGYLATKNVAVDLVTLSERLKAIGKLEAVGGNEYLTNLMDVIPSTVNFRHYVAILQKDETLRRLDRAAAAITKALNQPDDQQKQFDDAHAALQYAEKLIFDISKEDERQELTKLSQELPTVLNNFDLVAHDPAALRGIKTGYSVLDSITNGLQKGSLIIIGARPSVGKTSFAMNIVLNAALKSKAKVAVFSLEMDKVQLTNRAICSVARVSLSHALHGEMTPEEWTRLWDANAKLQNADIYLDASSSITASEIMRKCMRLKREHGLDLVMIDYLGLMGSPQTGTRNESRQEQVAANSRMMKTMAKELEVPVLLLAQLNRGIESRTGSDSEPMLSDLRESGAIEQDADMVMFIHKPKTETQSEQNEHSRDYEAKIIVAKNRSGPTPYFKLQFIGELTTFMNPEDVSKNNGVASVPVPPTKVKANLPEIVPLQDASDINNIF